MHCKFLKNGIRINEDGTVVPCCTFTGDLGIRYSDQFDFEEYLKSEPIKHLQDRLNKNIWPESCKNCQEKESLKSLSVRQQGEITIEDGLYLDVVIGKECNSDCVMCYSGQSSKITSRLKKNKPTFDVPKEDQYWIDQIDYDDWVEKSNFWKNLTDIFPKIETIKFLGGEPLLNKGLWQWLDSMEVSAHKNTKKLLIITNASIVDEERIHVFEGWKRIDFILSLDSIEQDLEWIRYGLKWKKIEQNIRVLSSIKDAVITVHSTLNLFNVASISRLIKWVDDNDLLFTMTPVTSPSLLSIRYAPKHILEDVLQELKTLRIRKIQNNIQLRGTKNFIEDAIRHNTEDPILRKSITNYFNNHRDQHMDWQTLRCTT